MKIAIQVPIKARSSTRVPNKNFRSLCGKPFSWWLLDRLLEVASVFDVDTMEDFRQAEKLSEF